MMYERRKLSHRQAEGHLKPIKKCLANDKTKLQYNRSKSQTPQNNFYEQCIKRGNFGLKT